MNHRYHVDFPALMRMYETNYAKLVRLLPHGDDVGDTRSYDIHGSCYDIEIEESTRYTTLVTIRLKGSLPEYLRPSMTVRLYHDARVAEVCSSQQISALKARYDYPNPRMLVRDEKHQVNQFLSDWLAHCIRSGIVKDSMY